MNEFIKVNSWFEKKYKAKSGVRYNTIKIALNLLDQRQDHTIVETGTTRMSNDWGAGMSTVLFAEYILKYGGDVTTIDLSKENIEFCKSITGAYPNIKYVVSDSLKFFKEYRGEGIDLLYLDSYDYPYGELLELYGGNQDIDKAIDTLKAIGDEEIVKKHFDIISPSQEHSLQEFKLALPHLAKNAIILIDDCDLPGGGKGRLTKEYLASIGAKCLLDSYQSLWIL